jgi:4-hydroxybenzoate polyprenyltransferase
MTYLKAFRPLNLLLMMGLILSVYFFLMRPIFDSYALELVLNPLHHVLLALSCTLIAAGGYLINNYYDSTSDAINHKNNGLTNKNWLLNAYFPVTMAGLVLGIYVAYRAGLLNLAIVHLICTFVLWKYAESWKGARGWGSLLVAALMGLLVLIPALFEFISLGVLAAVESNAFQYLGLTLLVYALFAFVSNYCRELVKTLEDREGDAAQGWQTFAIYFGEQTTRLIVGLLLLISLVGLIGLVYFFQWPNSDQRPAWYTLIAVILPLIWVIYLLYTSRSTADYHRLSFWLKIWMLGGVGSLAANYFFFYY